MEENPRYSTSDNAGGSSKGATYRLMSPAKLPISRSTSITIPPGSSFLESPVLLSNIKAEPSPTTGSLSEPPLMHGSGESVAISQVKNCYQSSSFDERTSSSFEFKFHTGSASSSFASLAIPAGVKQHGHYSQIQVNTISQSSLHKHRSARSNYELNQGGYSNSASTQLSSSDQKESISITPCDRTSDDGYNWRKYGQKLVKGIEFPRSYYKCTYPSCEVKKIFETSPSGQITEIVYKGSHEHPKPDSRRHNPGALTSIQEEKFDNDFSFVGQDALSPKQANEGGVDSSCSQIQNISNDDIDEDDPFSKRRKMEDGFNFAPVLKPIREQRVVVQTVSEVDILDDGYRWRKYGQKVVRGNPNPRSYYKCTNPGCGVRKLVERASHDNKSVITTYEGKHDHDVPTAKNSHREFSGTVPCAKITLEESGSVNLDLGFGTTNLIEAPQIPASHGIVNSGMNLYGSRENQVEGQSRLQAQPMHPSNHCTPNLGRILTGPSSFI